MTEAISHPQEDPLSLEKTFGIKKPIIGMLHLGHLLGQEEFRGLKFARERALEGLHTLESGGINGVLIENWKEESLDPYASQATLASLAILASDIAHEAHVPIGINVLNNDYKAAFTIAKLIDASFVQLDVFVDRVRTDYTFSRLAKENPFEINVDPLEVQRYRQSIDATEIPLLVFIQPKHYILLEEGKTIETSARQAMEAGANALIITRATGIAPSLDLIHRVKMVAGTIPVGIGSGFSRENAQDFLPHVDFAIVGTDLKVDHITDNPVDESSVRELMDIAGKFQS